jgi:hypothetical protein
MADKSTPVTPPTEEEIKQLTYVDHKTHIQCTLPNVLVITSCKKGKNGFVLYYTEASVRNAIQTAIATAKRGGYTSPNPTFILNYPTVYDPVKKRKTPKGLTFAWFADPALPNIFLGLNSDGSERMESYPDPNWVAPVADEWDEEEEEEFDPATFFLKAGKMSWADIQEKEDKKKEKQEAPMLTRKLPPIATLIVKQGAEDPEPLTIEAGFAKIKKKVQDECDLSLLHVFIPSWADLSDLLKRFTPFSCSSSYPILEVVQDRDPAKCHLYVSYPPGSDGAITAQMILFKFTYSKGKNEEVIHVDFAKKGAYERNVEKAPHYRILKLTSSMKKPPTSTIPQTFFRAGNSSTKPKQTNKVEGGWNTKPVAQKKEKKDEDGWETKGRKGKTTNPPPKPAPTPVQTEEDEDGLGDLIAWAKPKK